MICVIYSSPLTQLHSVDGSASTQRQCITGGESSNITKAHEGQASVETRHCENMCAPLLNPRIICSPHTVIPDFAVTCRRLTPGPGYLEALCEDNASTLFYKRIKRIDLVG